MTTRCVIMVLGLIASSGVAQTPHFVQQKINEPFVSSEINLIYQDGQRQLWFGSSAGLLKYDGQKLSTVQVEDTVVVTPHITALYADQDHTMWVGTESGHILTYTHQDGLQPRYFDEGWPKVPITGFAEDTTGQLWIATYGEGLYCYNGRHLYNYNVDDGLLGDDIYSITPDRHGNLWAGTDRGANICSFRKGVKSIESLTTEDGLPDQIVKAVRSDDHDRVWIGTHESGICAYNFAVDQIEHYAYQSSMGSVTSITIYDNREVWVGTESDGVWRYRTSYRDLTPLPGSSVPLKRISDVEIDTEGNLWLSGNSNDIYRAHRPFELAIVDVGDIQSLNSRDDGTVWVGTNNGLYTFKNSVATRHLPNLNLNITGIVEDPFGNVWIGTINRGIYVYHPTSGKRIHLNMDNGMMNNSIMSIAISGNDLWIASLGGGGHFDLKGNIMTDTRNGAAVKHLDALSSNFLYQVFIDHSGRPWFASDGDGAFVLENGSMLQIAGNDSIKLQTVYSITEDHRGHFWFNTPKNGLIEFDGTSYSTLQNEQGLRNLTISAIATDAHGDLVIAHANGIDILMPEDRHFMYFDDEIGISDLDIGLNAICTDRDGAVWIGGAERLIKYDAPKSMSIHPQTQLLGVSVFLDPINYHTQHTFPFRDNDLSFNYIGLWYTSPESVKYLYTLEGHDLDWNESRDRSVTYSNLPPGEYTFKVKASENTFFHDEPVAEYSFVVKKPVWMQLWFIVLTLVVLGGLVYAFIRSRERRSERLALQKKERIESQFMALKAQINPHFLFNSFNTLVTIIDENPDIAMEYVEKLSDFYRSILQYREKETISLHEELDLVKSYAFLLQTRYGGSLKLDLQIDSTQTEIPPLTLQMLVENAVKHNIISKSRPLTVTIQTNGEGYIVVSNNKQRKKTPVNSTSFGLPSIMKRYQLLTDKKVIVEDTATSFSVRVPLIKTTAHANSDH